MNDVINVFSNRQSVRSFTGEKVKEEDLEIILKTLLRMPSFKNLQALSFIVLNKKDKIEKLGDYCGGQKQVSTSDVVIVIVADFNKFIKALDKLGEDYRSKFNGMDILAQVFSDARIAATNIDIISSSLGYGSTIIGGVYGGKVDKIIELLKLPKYTMPLLGVTLGVPDKINPILKPRIKMSSTIFFDEYDEEKAINGVLEYNETLNDFKNQGLVK